MISRATVRGFCCLALVASISCGPPDAAKRAQVNPDDLTDSSLGGGGPAMNDALGPGGGGGGGAGGTIEVDAAIAPVDTAVSVEPDAALVSADKPAPSSDAPTPTTDPVLTVSQTAGVANTNLTSLGTVDWAHWGYMKAAAITRKSNVASPLISMNTVGTGTPGRYTDRPVHFSWSDGAPTASVTNTPDGIDDDKGAGNGFQITVQGALDRPRTLKLFVGAWQAVAKMTAKIGAKTYTDQSLNTHDPGADRIYTIVFQPSDATQKLVVTWTTQTTNAMYGNVTLQAASLSE